MPCVFCDSMNQAATYWSSVPHHPNVPGPDCSGVDRGGEQRGPWPPIPEHVGDGKRSTNNWLPDS